MHRAAELTLFAQHAPGATQDAMDHGHRSDLSARFAQYAAQHFSKSFSSQLNRLRRAVQRAFDQVEVTTMSSLSDQRLEQLGHLHSSRQATKCAHGHGHRRVNIERDGLHRLLKWAEREGRLRIYQLRLDRELASFQIVLRAERTECGWIMAFDDDAKKCSPTKLRTVAIYEEIAGKGLIQTVDWLADHRLVKEQFCNRTTERCSVVPANRGEPEPELAWPQPVLRTRPGAESPAHAPRPGLTMARRPELSRSSVVAFKHPSDG